MIRVFSRNLFLREWLIRGLTRLGNSMRQGMLWTLERVEENEKFLQAVEREFFLKMFCDILRIIIFLKTQTIILEK